MLTVGNVRLNSVAVLELTHKSTVVLVTNRILRGRTHRGNVGDARVNLGEVKGVHEVAELLTAPVVHFLHVERLAVGLGPLLNKERLTLVSGMLGKHTTLARERRSNVEGHTETRADRLQTIRRREWILHPFTRRVP